MYNENMAGDTNIPKSDSVGKEKSQVEKQIDILGKSRSRLSDSISELEDRLSSVLRNEIAEKSLEGAETPQAPLTQLAETIRTQEYGISHLHGKIRDIIGRLEL